MGQPSETGTRLLKVTVSSLQFKRQLLSKVKSLHKAKSDQLRKVFITPNLSPQEREYQRNLRAELHNIDAELPRSKTWLYAEDK